jgi:hypothetical protein
VSWRFRGGGLKCRIVTIFRAWGAPKCRTVGATFESWGLSHCRTVVLFIVRGVPILVPGVRQCVELVRVCGKAVGVMAVV